MFSGMKHVRMIKDVSRTYTSPKSSCWFGLGTLSRTLANADSLKNTVRNASLHIEGVLDLEISSPSHSNVAATPHGIFNAAKISVLVSVLSDEGVIPASEI